MALEGFAVTKKAVRGMLRDFVMNKLEIFSNTKRGTNAIEDKVVDILYQEVLKVESMNEGEVNAIVEEIMQSVVELADKLGFTKIIYDFILICQRHY